MSYPTNFEGLGRQTVEKNVYKKIHVSFRPLCLYEKTTWKNTKNFCHTTSGHRDRASQSTLVGAGITQIFAKPLFYLSITDQL